MLLVICEEGRVTASHLYSLCLQKHSQTILHKKYDMLVYTLQYTYIRKCVAYCAENIARGHAMIQTTEYIGGVYLPSQL
jgi:hypothetical protein